ncbi:MAG: metallophosphoesterase [Archaeoglobaceae archaeon]
MNFTLTPERVCLIGDAAVIADLHLGIENVMQESGVAIPKMQIGEILRNVKRIIRKYNISKLVVAGDLKHEFSRNLPYEWEDVRTFVETVRGEGVELEVVRGNHDNFLAAILAEYGIELKEVSNVAGYCIVHGHRECDCERIVMGHEHPSIKVRVRGALYSYPCYLVADRRIVVVPAFSPLVLGSDVLSGDFLSPILRRANRIEVYAIEEDEVVYLGTIDDIRAAISGL